ncbi:hypothetical protein [Silvimonas amylolytica]|uniref:NHL repeat-containing protein n=1 Tax=Silvimonas amylolytica TaxID=449663 RepID=A0ABQ2PH20_9NEIS|nr:hypothetical protein [Silvimonas amylolytica]GGP24254.1 hypothetical protein GCM10010971_00730 [Silvimonas amylolytica]
MKTAPRLFVVFLSAALAACGGDFFGSSDGGSTVTPTPVPSAPASATPTPTPAPDASSYTVGGVLSGLSGGTVTLINNSDSLALSANGPFTFNTAVSAGGAYQVVVSTQPSGQVCKVSGGGGSGLASNITNVAVQCSAPVIQIAPLWAFAQPFGTAVDAQGNVYVADGGAGNVYKVAPGATTATPIVTGTPFVAPVGVAIDAGGTVYVTDYNGPAVYQIAPGATTPSQIAPGFFFSPTGIAVDGSGNIYVGDDVLNAVYKIAAGTTTPVPVASVPGPQYIAIDAAGNLYVTAGSDVYEIAAGASTPNPLMLSPGLSQPAGIAVDATGNVYVVDAATNSLYKIAPGATAPVAISTGTTALNMPFGLTLGRDGNLYIADVGDAKVYEVVLP